LSDNPVLVWFRRDLRLSDNPSLHSAIKRSIETGTEVIPVFIYSPEEEGAWTPGEASNWWLHHSLLSLATRIEEKGSKLIIRRGGAKQILFDLVKETGATSIFWNQLYEPEIISRDTGIKDALTKAGIEAKSFNGALLKEPWTFKNQSGKPFQVFTPFWRALQKVLEIPETLPEPLDILHYNRTCSSLKVEELSLLPKIKWDRKFYETWKPGEVNAQIELDKFLSSFVDDYGSARDIPSVRGTSRMSPSLHFGEISPGQIFSSVNRLKINASSGVEHYLREIGWREFAHHLLVHFPHTPLEPLRPNFKNFPWANDPKSLLAWQQGKTGYPIIDAGMRELWATGWMHNRVRMIVSSFLVKDLLISWVDGAKWFWDTLVDASLASNTLGWQWSGGCGADAAPFFRIFNPITQGEKFDSNGEYVRKWIPELSNLPNKFIHKPWEAPDNILKSAGVTLGESYPLPIVDHSLARTRALRAFDKVKAAN